jgi:SEC-C motif-containing protein
MSKLPAALPAPQRGQPCSCGSGKAYELCCEPILKAGRPAATAEELMRSRFTAHVARDYAHLHRSYAGTASEAYVELPDEPAIGWTRLEIHAHEPNAQPDLSYVDFSAYYVDANHEYVLQEKAEFRRHPSIGWIYTRPVRTGPAPVKAAVKPGRNEPCSCGSGRKYKHCCISKAA